MEFYEIKINPEKYRENTHETLGALRTNLIKELIAKEIEADAFFEHKYADNKRIEGIVMYLETDYEAIDEIKKIWQSLGVPPMEEIAEISKHEYYTHKG